MVLIGSLMQHIATRASGGALNSSPSIFRAGATVQRSIGISVFETNDNVLVNAVALFRGTFPPTGPLPLLILLDSDPKHQTAHHTQHQMKLRGHQMACAHKSFCKFSTKTTKSFMFSQYLCILWSAIGNAVNSSDTETTVLGFCPSAKTSPNSNWLQCIKMSLDCTNGTWLTKTRSGNFWAEIKLRTVFRDGNTEPSDLNQPQRHQFILLSKHSRLWCIWVEFSVVKATTTTDCMSPCALASLLLSTVVQFVPCSGNSQLYNEPMF